MGQVFRLTSMIAPRLTSVWPAASVQRHGPVILVCSLELDKWAVMLDPDECVMNRIN